MGERIQKFSTSFVALAQGLYYLAAASTFIYISVHLHKLIDLNGFVQLMVKLIMTRIGGG